MGDVSEEAVRETSDWMAEIRAEENERPDSFLFDPYSAVLVGDRAEAAEQLATLEELCAPSGSVPVRGRIGDEVLRRAVTEGVRQAVTLGAGSDTRPWRVELPEDFQYFEMDLPGQLTEKVRLLGEPKCRRVSVEADLRVNWSGRLRDAGFDPDRPVVWVVEGLLHYLRQSEADGLLDVLTAYSPKGSVLVGDVPHEEFLREQRHAGFLAWMKERGSPFIGTSADPAQWLREAGWTAQSHLPAGLLAGECDLIPVPPARLFADHRRIWYFHALR